MMERLRTAANSLVLKIIFGVIILSFILTGVGNYLVGGARDYAVEVNGQKVSMQSFEQAVQAERSQLQQQLGEQFSALAGNEDYVKQMRKQVLNRIVDDVLLDQYAAQMGLGIDDSTIKNSIRGMPYFQTEGKFDNEKYLALINRMGFSPEGYAEQMRKELMKQQLIQGYMATDFALPVEADTLAGLILQSREVRLATISIKNLQSAQKASDEELQAYYQQNSANFLSPEKVKLSYIELDATQFSDKVQVTDQDIESYYTQNKESFTQLEQRKYRIIQLKSEADAKVVLKQLQDGADFGALVKEKSTDVVSRKTDGFTDWMEKDSTPDVVLKANLTEKGQLSGVIQSGDGFLIVRLEDIQPQQSKPLVDVKDEVAKKLKQEKALDAYYKEQQKLSDAAANDNESLASAETALGVKAKETDWFSRDNAPAALNFPNLLQEIFSGKLYDDKGNPLGNSDVINVEGDRAFVVRVVAHEQEKTKPFAEVRSDVLTLVQRNKAEAAARAEGEKVLVALKEGKGDEAMKQAGLTFGEKQTFTRQSEERQLADAIFALAHPAKDKVVYGMAQDNQDNIVLIALDSVQPGVLKDEEKKPFADNLAKSNSGILFDSLMSSLRSKAKIEFGDAIQNQ